MRKLLSVFVLLFAYSFVAAQQPQTQGAPIYSVNAKYTQGVGPGYWPTQLAIPIPSGTLAAATGLNLNIGSGTAFCNGSIQEYAGGTLTLNASTTNYVYLNTGSLCIPAVKTTAFTTADIPVATIVTGSSSITSIDDDRTMFSQGSNGGGSSGITALLPTTVASLPAAATSTGWFEPVTDGASATDCTTGHGSTVVLCQSNGSIWLAFSPAQSGPVNATQVNGAGIPASQTCLGSNSSSQLIDGTCSGGSSSGPIPANATFFFTGDSKNDDDGGVLAPAIAISGWTCNGTTSCTFTASAAHNLTAGQWVNVRYLSSWFSPPTGLTIGTGYTLFQVESAGLTSTQFEIAYSANAGSCSASCGSVRTAMNNVPFAVTSSAGFPTAAINNTYMMLPSSVTIGGVASAYATLIHPHSPAVTGNPGYLVLWDTEDDVASCPAASTIETAYQSVFSQAHADGWIVVVASSPNWLANQGPTGCSTVFNVMYQVNQWLVGQGKQGVKASNATSTQYWDIYADFSTAVWDANNTNFVASNGGPGPYGAVVFSHIMASDILSGSGRPVQPGPWQVGTGAGTTFNNNNYLFVPESDGELDYWNAARTGVYMRYTWGTAGTLSLYGNDPKLSVGGNCSTSFCVIYTGPGPAGTVMFSVDQYGNIRQYTASGLNPSFEIDGGTVKFPGIKATVAGEFMAIDTSGNVTAAIPPGGGSVSINGVSQSSLNVTGMIPVLCADSSGSATAQSCTTTPSVTLVSGNCFEYKTTTSNTGNLTISVNGSAALSVEKWLSTTTLAAGDIPAGHTIGMCYNGSVLDAMTIGNAPTGGGTSNATQIQGVAVATTAPTDGQVEQYVAAASQYEPKTISAGTSNATEIQGIPVDTTAPTDGQVYEYKSSSGKIVPTTPTGGSGGGVASLFGGADPTGSSAPTFVQQNSAQAGAVTTTNPVSSGDLLVVGYGGKLSPNCGTVSVSDTLSTSFGSPLAQNFTSDTNLNVYVYAAKATSSGLDTITVSSSCASPIVSVMEFGGVTTTTDFSAQLTTGIGQTTNTQSGTTTATNDLIIMGLAAGVDVAATVSETPSSGWIRETNQSISDSTGLFMAWEVNPTVSAVSGSWTGSSSTYWAATMISLKASTSPVAGTDGQIYYQTSTTPYTPWVFHSGWEKLPNGLNIPFALGLNNAAGIPAISATNSQLMQTMYADAGDLVAVLCRWGSGSGQAITAFDSDNDSLSSTVGESLTSGYSQMFYAFGVAHGSQNYFCTATDSTTFPGEKVMVFHPGSLTGLLDTSSNGTITTATATPASGSFSTSAAGLIVACFNPIGSVSGTPSMSIGGTTATLIGYDNTAWCGYVKTPGAESSITANFSNSTSVTWSYHVLAFK